MSTSIVLLPLAYGSLQQSRVAENSKIFERVAMQKSLRTPGVESCHISLNLTGKGQNVKNHFIESQKKNIESLKFRTSKVKLNFRRSDLIRTSKVFSERRKSNLSDFQIDNYLWRKYLWRQS
jgi:hypothetical protein